MEDNVLATQEHCELGDATFSAQFASVLTTLSAFRGQITQVQQLVRGLEKSVNKEVKALKRAAQKGRVRVNKRRSGFAQPAKISKELCEFMDKAEGTKIARTEVTQFIIGYINENKLQNPDNRKEITPDDKLRKLLGVGDSDEVTYFNLQKYMNRHFPSDKDSPTSKTS